MSEWACYALASAGMLAAYDLAKKASVKSNSVLGVLLGSTTCGSLAFLLVLLVTGRFGTAVSGVDAKVLTLGLLKSCIVAASWVYLLCA